MSSGMRQLNNIDCLPIHTTVIFTGVFDLMRILRVTVSLLFVIVLALFCIFKIQESSADTTYPVITIENPTLDVSIHATSDDLLAGVTAYDEKDGDLTHKIIVESISRFTEYGVCTVSYAVCDDDNHAVNATRTIRYIDYTSPRFTLSGPLVYGISQNMSIRNRLGAIDSIDGDISSKVIITADEYSSAVAGKNFISAKVTNSKWDMISIELPVYIENIPLSAPTITLQNYLVYVKAGDNLNIMENFVSAVDKEDADLSNTLQIDTNLDLDTPGVYEVHYRVYDAFEREGHSILIVIVEE